MKIEQMLCPDNSLSGEVPIIQVLLLMSGFNWCVVFLVGSCPSNSGPGGQYVAFIFIPWEIIPGGELS